MGNDCQWAMIRDALTAGCDVSDLRCITPVTDDPHVGLVRFKVGTGGRNLIGGWT